ncbi:MAG: putative lipoprotein, partial [Flavobacteriales bacterium]
MAKPFKSKLVNLVLNSVAIGVIMSLVACGESSSSTQGALFSQAVTPPTAPSNNFNQTLLLQSLTDNVIVPTYTKFAQLAIDQETAIGLYCDAVISQATDTDAKQISAKQSWRDAMAVWQIAEVMQIGPLLDNNNALRNKIYSWPNTSSCALDQDVVLAEQASYDISSRTASRKGLDAIEYLLFNPSLDH